MSKEKNLSKPVQRLIDSCDPGRMMRIIQACSLNGVHPTPESGASFALAAAVLLELALTREQFLELCAHAWDVTADDTAAAKAPFDKS